MNVNLHIERLVLEGLQVDPADQARLQAAVVAELTRLFAAGGVRHDLQQGGAVPFVQAGSIRAGGARGMQGSKAADTPAALGGRIAQAVYRGIGK